MRHSPSPRVLTTHGGASPRWEHRAHVAHATQSPQAASHRSFTGFHPRRPLENASNHDIPPASPLKNVNGARGVLKRGIRCQEKVPHIYEQLGVSHRRKAGTHDGNSLDTFYRYQILEDGIWYGF